MKDLLTLLYIGFAIGFAFEFGEHVAWLIWPYAVG